MFSYIKKKTIDRACISSMAVRMYRIPFACSCLHFSGKVCEQWRSICVCARLRSPRFHAIIALLAIHQNTTFTCICIHIYMDVVYFRSPNLNATKKIKRERERQRKNIECVQKCSCVVHLNEIVAEIVARCSSAIDATPHNMCNLGSAEDASLSACCAYLFLFMLLTIIYDYLNFYL